jgi:GT2 family glycosyltransferase
VHGLVLSAVIVCYKTPAELAGALGSLRAQSRAPDEIVIVDHGLADGEGLDRAAFDGVRIEQPPANRGFGSGCNLGTRGTTGDVLLFLNADVVLSAETLEVLLHRLHADARIGVVGPRILSGGKLQLSARAFPSFRTGLLGRRSLLTRVLIRARRYPAEFRHTYGGGGEVDWVSGACMLVRREAFESVDGFDEQFFMYWEDADLCRRLHARGWSVHYEPSAVVHHATGASGTSERTIRAFHESAARFAERHIARSRPQRALIVAVLRARAWAAMRTFRRARRLD